MLIKKKNKSFRNLQKPEIRNDSCIAGNLEKGEIGLETLEQAKCGNKAINLQGNNQFAFCC